MDDPRDEEIIRIIQEERDAYDEKTNDD